MVGSSDLESWVSPTLSRDNMLIIPLHSRDCRTVTCIRLHAGILRLQDVTIFLLDISLIENKKKK
jgi:hypothetical protein